jgi:hypothetical protein
VAFDSCDLGSFEELKEKVSEFQPHIVHLTGHVAVLEGEGRFAFEKKDGMADLVSSAELRRFLAGSGVQCVFVGGCQSGKAPQEALAGICQGLVGEDVALAVGWADIHRLRRGHRLPPNLLQDAQSMNCRSLNML